MARRATDRIDAIEQVSRDAMRAIKSHEEACDIRERAHESRYEVMEENQNEIRSQLKTITDHLLRDRRGR